MRMVVWGLNAHRTFHINVMSSSSRGVRSRMPGMEDSEAEDDDDDDMAFS